VTMAGTPTERAVFEKAMAASGAPSAAAPVTAPAPVKDTRVPPEAIWAVGAKVKEQKAAKAAAAKASTPPPEVVQDPEDTRERALDGKFTTPEKKQEAFDDAKYELARNALSRSGWKKKELDAMEPEELVKRGLSRAKALEKDDEAHRLAKELREAKAAPKKEGQTEQGRNPVAVQPPDLSGIIKPLAEKLLLDEDGAKALKQTFEEFASIYSKTAVAPLQERLSQFEQMQAESGARTEAQLIDGAREEVGKRFPDLLDPDTFETVAENVRVLGNLPKYQQIASLPSRVNACFEDACKLLGLQPSESDSQVRAEQAKALKRASGSTVGDRARPVALTQKEKDREWFDQVTAKNGLD
jgi:hypothetical protein